MYTSSLLFLNIGTPELMIILLVVLLLFGGQKLPELARGLGKGIREFKDASEGVKREIHRNINSVSDDLDVDSDQKKTDTPINDHISSN
ncbi:twin-arginine translocase TatA/TatE family subunit [Pedobacter sp. HMF7647]|uniref:Sec-independent protein translocase protein TatA n=1 Tax=Hufsiella arboris TaxID=2695275 RepID=A0A7K1YAY1_9SPHI|nr:twin-arginine translocase TatA/TatE family subunit [Hufsiella arboris]MXV51744.1 twin-arginine translocase TatA/TatE family subunit [Hufsiella arboris]